MDTTWFIAHAIALFNQLVEEGEDDVTSLAVPYGVTSETTEVKLNHGGDGTRQEYSRCAGLLETDNKCLDIHINMSFRMRRESHPVETKSKPHRSIKSGADASSLLHF